MRRPDAARIANGLRRTLDAQRKACEDLRKGAPREVRYGRIDKITSNAMRARLPGAALGEQCRVMSPALDAEVIAVEGRHVWLAPYAEPTGVANGALVQALGASARVAVGEHLVGEVLDGLGRSLATESGASRADVEWRALDAEPPPPLRRALVSTHLPIGIRAIDGMLTCGRGQRLGIFAAAGGGKSTLLAMMCQGAAADVIVLALIGERGREVREFIEQGLTPQARARTVCVVATSDRPALERMKAAYTATAIAEAFRDEGKNVLLLMDSLTRFGRAVRDIGMAAGEPLGATSGLPPSFYARLPRLLERAGTGERGSITAFYTVLVEGDNLDEPLADEVRSIVDGHIVLSRRLAQENHYPAIDVPKSLSRVMTQVASVKHRESAARVRRAMALAADVELLVRVGEYQAGNDPDTDEALARAPDIRAFLCQAQHEVATFDDTLAWLEHLAN
ncbi:FliI/YscN family ATPase [Pandoraea sputorum]|uniref:Probable ATP synthase YscN n=1 Tax=Pandoraea sputorum TaxID=93222 RepID=A0A239SC76_9BURK|nr:FliI/YscN family ATPase [Pandoraea sputorum]AJC16170.1 EscN/YscN/HrcN family type III secretion system ATPase [Pandoraea sputorum]SNU82364.1 Probable ATP synthase YscN [Pandoraea sputorum]VVE46727.1 EscN/YscN/HrcN family type III secretion system ATPase [Pandoraea sputorum]VVE82262.1 EscN/YscN/HrcN family type III secretion system ATPase [Pandoraea sputorum]